MVFSRDQVKLLKDMFGREEDTAFKSKDYESFDALLELESSVMNLVRENMYGGNKTTTAK